MSHALRISEATVLAFHAVAVLVRRDSSRKPLPAAEIAAELQVSTAHLAKVLQRLERAGVVESTRGPRGGFRIGHDSQHINLLQIYELFEGALDPKGCLLKRSTCVNGECILGELLGDINRRVAQSLGGIRVGDVGPRVGGSKRTSAARRRRKVRG